MKPQCDVSENGSIASGWTLNGIDEPPAIPAARLGVSSMARLPGRLLFGHLIRPGLRRGVASIHTFSALPVHVFPALTRAGSPRCQAERESDCGNRHTQFYYAHRYLHLSGLRAAPHALALPKRAASPKALFAASLAVGRPTSKNSQTWCGLRTGEVLLPAARPTLLLLKELLCIRRGVSCCHRADNRSEGDEDRYKLRHGLRHRLRHRLRLWHPHGCALSIPETVSSTVITNGATDANRWISHARVKRSDQSCSRRHSQDRFVQGCCLLRDRSHQRCTESDHRGMKSRSRLAT